MDSKTKHYFAGILCSLMAASIIVGICYVTKVRHILLLVISYIITQLYIGNIRFFDDVYFSNEFHQAQNIGAADITFFKGLPQLIVFMFILKLNCSCWRPNDVLQNDNTDHLADDGASSVIGSISVASSRRSIVEKPR